MQKSSWFAFIYYYKLLAMSNGVVANMCEYNPNNDITKIGNQKFALKATPSRRWSQSDILCIFNLLFTWMFINKDGITLKTRLSHFYIPLQRQCASFFHDHWDGQNKWIIILWLINNNIHSTLLKTRPINI